MPGLSVRTCRGDVISVGREAPENYVVSKAGIETANDSFGCGAGLWPPVCVNSSFIVWKLKMLCMDMQV